MTSICAGLPGGGYGQDSYRSALGFDFVAFYFFKQFIAVVVEVSGMYSNLNKAMAILELTLRIPLWNMTEVDGKRNGGC